MANKLLSVSQVAELMQIDPAKVYRFIEKGLIRTIKLSRRGTKVPESEFDSFVEKYTGMDLTDLDNIKLLET